MKKAMVLGLVVLLVIGSAVAALAKAQKANLTDVDESTVGFVIFNNPYPEDGEGNIEVVVSLKKGSPTTTYEVWLHGHCPGTGDLITHQLGDLITNPRGKGNWAFGDVSWDLLIGIPGGWEMYVTVGENFTSDTVELDLKVPTS